MSSAPLIVFPDVVGDSLEIKPEYVVKTQLLGENQAVRYRKWTRPRYTFSLQWSMLEPADARSITNHVANVAGAWKSFEWFMWTPFHWQWVPVGVSSGTETVWTLPGKEMSEHEFFTNTGTALTGSVSTATGTYGEDRLTLATALAAGTKIWMNFRGRRRFTVVFADDEQPMPRTAETGYSTFNTTFKQVK